MIYSDTKSSILITKKIYVNKNHISPGLQSLKIHAILKGARHLCCSEQQAMSIILIVEFILPIKYDILKSVTSKI